MLLGGIAFVEIPVDLMPEAVYPTISVRAEYPGVAPEEMENLVARPLEEVFSAALGVEEISSTSAEGRVSIRVSFEYGSNLDEAANELGIRLDRRCNDLPDDMERPIMFKYDPAMFPIMFPTVSASHRLRLPDLHWKFRLAAVAHRPRSGRNVSGQPAS